MCPFIVVCVVVALIVAFGPKATSSSRLNPCRTCKWFINGIEPKCGFYKTSYDVLGKKLVVHEYAEHVRKNEHMCGEEGYMHEMPYASPQSKGSPGGAALSLLGAKAATPDCIRPYETLPTSSLHSGRPGYRLPLEENETALPFAYALLWPLNVPFAVLTGLVEFLEEEAIISRGF